MGEGGGAVDGAGVSGGGGRGGGRCRSEWGRGGAGPNRCSRHYAIVVMCVCVYAQLCIEEAR